MAVLASLLLFASTKRYLAYPLLSTLLCSCVCNCYPPWWSYTGTGSREGTSVTGRILSTCASSLRLVLLPNSSEILGLPDTYQMFLTVWCIGLTHADWDSSMLHDLKSCVWYWIVCYDGSIVFNRNQDIDHEHSSVTPPCLPCSQLGATMVIFLFWIWKLEWGPESAVSWHTWHVRTGLL